MVGRSVALEDAGLSGLYTEAVWATVNEDLTSTQFSILLFLARKAYDDGTTGPLTLDAFEKTRFSKGAVLSALDSLEDAGYLSRVRSTKGNRYALALGRILPNAEGQPLARILPIGKDSTQPTRETVGKDSSQSVGKDSTQPLKDNKRDNKDIIPPVGPPLTDWHSVFHAIPGNTDHDEVKCPQLVAFVESKLDGDVALAAADSMLNRLQYDPSKSKPWSYEAKRYSELFQTFRNWARNERDRPAANGARASPARAHRNEARSEAEFAAREKW